MIEQIIEDFKNHKIKFHTYIENQMFSECLVSYQDDAFISSATVGFSLYEKIFTSRLIRESSTPKGFTPSKENIEEQITFITKTEDEVVNIEKLSFRAITSRLQDLNIITQDEKNEYDIFYSKYRNPVLHGLTYRLYVNIYNKDPDSFLELDTTCDAIYKAVSELIIKQIYVLMKDASFKKK